MMQKIELRKARVKDLSAVYQLEQYYIEEIEPWNLSKWLNAKMRVEEQLVINTPRMIVALAGQKIIGHAYWSLCDEVPVVFSIYVCGKYRGCQVATRLLRACEKEIAQAGYSRCHLATYKTNPAQHFFQAVGYKLVATGDWLDYEKVFSRQAEPAVK